MGRPSQVGVVGTCIPTGAWVASYCAVGIRLWSSKEAWVIKYSLNDCLCVGLCRVAAGQVRAAKSRGSKTKTSKIYTCQAKNCTFIEGLGWDALGKSQASLLACKSNVPRGFRSRPKIS